MSVHPFLLVGADEGVPVDRFVGGKGHTTGSGFGGRVT